ncbi:hypothetical protein [Paenibacillus spiritus]|nr:hypothetical protein [Paenibacillus spiritus]
MGEPAAGRAGEISRGPIERTAERALDIQAQLGRMGDFTSR